MNKLIQERSHIHASIVKSALFTRQTARYMNELTQERSPIHVTIVKSPLVIHPAARNMKKHMQKPALSNESNIIENQEH